MLLPVYRPVSVHSSDSIHHAGALVEERCISELGVEVTVVEQVILIALVALDALQPALHGVHRLQHGAQIVVYRDVAAQRAARTHDRFLLRRRL